MLSHKLGGAVVCAGFQDRYAVLLVMVDVVFYLLILASRLLESPPAQALGARGVINKLNCLSISQ
jgi:hypothetical protein